MKILIGSDFHFRSNKPIARVDDYRETQHKEIMWLKELSKDYETFISAGDIVHSYVERARPMEFYNYLLQNLPDNMYTIYGNHDVYGSDISTTDNTTVGALVNAGKIKILDSLLYNVDSGDVRIDGFHYGQEPNEDEKISRNLTKIAVWHNLVLQESHPFIKAPSAEEILKKYPGYDLMIIGDNHKTFIVVDGHRVLLSPGSFKIDTADQIDFKPCLFEYDLYKKELKPIAVPDFGVKISVEHIEKKNARSERQDLLPQKFRELEDISLDFEANLNNWMIQNEDTKVNESIQEWLTAAKVGTSA